MAECIVQINHNYTITLTLTKNELKVLRDICQNPFIENESGDMYRLRDAIFTPCSQALDVEL